MSRRNQARRRRTYNRRQHEVRERRSPNASGMEWLVRDDEFDWNGTDMTEERGPQDGGVGGFAR